MSNEKTIQLRDTEGKYRHSFEKLCVCGHPECVHAAIRLRTSEGWQQPCVDSDEHCEGGCFRKAEVTR